MRWEPEPERLGMEDVQSGLPRCISRQLGISKVWSSVTKLCNAAEDLTGCQFLLDTRKLSCADSVKNHEDFITPA